MTGAWLSNAFLNFLVGWYFGNRTKTRPSSLWAALYTTAPTDNDGTGAIEPTGYGYARVEITNNTTRFPDPINGLCSVGGVIRWPKAVGGAHGEIEGIGIYEVESGGTPVCGVNFALADRRTMNDGETVEYEDGQLTVGLASPNTGS